MLEEQGKGKLAFLHNTIFLSSAPTAGKTKCLYTAYANVGGLQRRRQQQDARMRRMKSLALAPSFNDQDCHGQPSDAYFSPFPGRLQISRLYQVEGSPFKQEVEAAYLSPGPTVRKQLVDFQMGEHLYHTEMERYSSALFEFFQTAAQGHAGGGGGGGT